MRTQRFLVLAELVSFSLYLLGILIATLLYPGYNHAAQFISELGSLNSLSRSVMNYGVFVPVGILVVIFALLVFTKVRQHWLSTTGAIILLLYGVADILSSFFSCETNDKAANPIASETIHNTVGLGANVIMIIGLFLWVFSFCRSEAYKPL